MTTSKYMTRPIDPDTGDMIIGSSWLYGQEAIAQTVATNLKLWLGESHVNRLEGMPWGEILGKGMSQSRVEAIIRNCISTTIGVTGIATFNMAFDQITRALTVTTTVITEFGITALISVTGVV